MNEIMNDAASQTPIEIALGIDAEGMTPRNFASIKQW